MAETPFSHLLDNPDWRVLFVSDSAASAIKEMFEQLEQIHTEHGDGKKYHEAVRSLGHCLSTLVGRNAFGNHAAVRRFEFGGPSLLVLESGGFEFGVNFSTQSQIWSLNS